jgi:hypothetical protein
MARFSRSINIPSPKEDCWTISPDFECLVPHAGCIVTSDCPISPVAYPTGPIGHSVRRISDEHVGTGPPLGVFEAIPVDKDDRVV